MALLHPRMRGGMLSFEGVYPELTNIQVGPGGCASWAGLGGQWQSWLCSWVGQAWLPAPCSPLTVHSTTPAPPSRPHQWLIQLPLLVAASAGGGLLGSAFNVLKRRALQWRQRRPGLAWRLAEGLAVAAITVAATVGLPAAFGSCLQVCSGFA